MLGVPISLRRAIGASTLILAMVAMPASLAVAKGGGHGGGHHGGGGSHHAASVHRGGGSHHVAAVHRGGGSHHAAGGHRVVARSFASGRSFNQGYGGNHGYRNTRYYSTGYVNRGYGYGYGNTGFTRIFIPNVGWRRVPSGGLHTLLRRSW